MAKLDRDEFNKKYSEKITDNDELLIELMEDVTDSMEDVKSKENEEISRLKSELELKSQEYEDLKSKYKERFLSSEEMPREKEVERLEEKEVIDIREI